MRRAIMKNRYRLLTLLLAMFLFVTAVQTAFAQRDLKDIPPVDPELERKTFQMADGFEVNLFASDPKIAKPIQMNFDPQGRLWIASSEVYPHIKPGQKANDKILILEDIDGDGKSDKTTIFADGLLIPTGVEPGDGGAYVANSTELLHFRDTDGDGKADERRIVLSGFGTEDTHHILHTLRWGPDGMLYMNQSIYIHSHIETPYGVRRLNAGGIWQFRPETMRLEVYARGWINPWGHQLDEFGQSFVTDGAGGEGINYVVPGAAYPTAVGVPRIMHGLNPGSPKYCGMEIVGGRHLPDDWQGNIITNDFRGHRVCRFVISDDGSGFASRQEADLISSRHVAFRPVDIKMGPDGAIYIADWYNPIIQHGEVDFRDPRRDHTHGRIWRVTYRGRKSLPRPKLVGVETTKLLDELKSPEMWARQNAKRVLKERGKKVLPELVAWVKGLDTDDPLVDRHRLEALWMYQSLDVPETELLQDLLSSKDARIRAAATRVVQHWQDRLSNPLALLATMITDSNPRVRLEAVRVLGHVRDPHSVEIAMRALEHPLDRFLDYALWLTARDLEPLWLERAKSGELKFGGRVKHLTFALAAVGSPDVVPLLIFQLAKNEREDGSERERLLGLISELGRPKDLSDVFGFAVGTNMPVARKVIYLKSLAEATRRRNVRPAGDLTRAVRKLLEWDDTELQSIAALCAGLWKLESLREPVTHLIHQQVKDNSLRQEPIDGLVAFGGKQSEELFHSLAESAKSRQVRMIGSVALSRLNLTAGSLAAAKLLGDLKTGDDPGDLIAAFLQRKQGPTKLAAALQNRSLPSDVAKVGLRVVGASGRKDTAGLIAALSKAGSITGKPKPLSAAEMTKMITSVKKGGNARRGENVFRRGDLSCLKCHAIAGAGGKVGPDLISLGASAQIDYLIESLIEPSKKVKENYQTLVVATDLGKVFAGVKVRQTDTDLILRDAEDREIAIRLDAIDDQSTGASIMPVGLTEKLTQRELVDLVRFLSELGKVGSLTVSKEPIVRRWRVMRPTDEARNRLRRTSYATAATDDSAFIWDPAYSTVSGILPVDNLPEIRVRNRVAAGTRGVSFAHFELDVTTAGKVGLLFNSIEGLKLWLDSVPVELSRQTNLDLQQGRHRLTVFIELSRRNEGLRVQLTTRPDDSTRVQIVGGK